MAKLSGEIDFGVGNGEVEFGNGEAEFGNGEVEFGK
jgi:hypothetical protein